MDGSSLGNEPTNQRKSRSSSRKNPTNGDWGLMGEADIMRINPIYKIVTAQCKQYGWPYQFKEDLGTYETAFLAKVIEDINNTDPTDNVVVSLPDDYISWKETKKDGWTLQEPDIWDFNYRIIIEYEEETGPKKPGAKYAKKAHGHPGDPTGTRDIKRDKNYSGFRFCKIWESEPMDVVKVKLHYFLADCYCNRDLTIYTNGYLTIEEFSKARKSSMLRERNWIKI